MSDKKPDGPSEEVLNVVQSLVAGFRVVSEPEQVRRMYSPETFAIQQGHVGRFVETLRLEWEKAPNPLLAWRAYVECRAFELPLPAWVLHYLDQAATNLLDLADEPPRNPAPAVMEALSLKEPGRSGRGTAFTSYMDTTALQIACDVHLQIRAGDKADFAIDAVAKQWGVSRTTVWRAWKQHSKAFEDLS